MDTEELSATILLLAQSSFYASGRGNSIASIDLANVFNGLDGSSVPAVMLQALLSNWVGPAWWSLTALRLLSAGDRGAQDSERPDESDIAAAWSEHVALQALFTICSSLALMLSCLCMQDEPELWTVLAPKYAMACLWAGFHHTLVETVLGSSLLAAVAP